MMNYILQRVALENPKEFVQFKQKFPSIKQEEKKMKMELRQERKKNKSVIEISEEEKMKIEIESHKLTTTFYDNFDAVDLDDEGII